MLVSATLIQAICNVRFTPQKNGQRKRFCLTIQHTIIYYKENDEKKSIKNLLRTLFWL